MSFFEKLHDKNGDLITLKELKKLIASGENINEQDEEGNTYLHYCAMSNISGIVEVLCRAGADIHLKNKQGKAPVDIAWENDMLAVILKSSRICWELS